jgi:ATP-dependent Zn protease
MALLAIIVCAMLLRHQKEKESHDEEAAASSISSDEAFSAIDDGRVFGYRADFKGIFLYTEDGTYLVETPVHPRLVEEIRGAEIPWVAPQRPSPASSSGANFGLIWPIALGAVALLALIYFLKKMRGGNLNNIFELRKTKARPVADADKAKFADIGGNREAVELLADIVDFLKAPKRWAAAGTRIPRGVLVVGPPGSGKTLLARAVAGETNSAFFYTSASEFVEMFVGVGAARVRDTFEKAAAQQPAVIFIDELDAVGRRRGSGLGTMHEEREQTLNQLLVLMDGLERHERLVAIAATNRPDVLDPALLRSGRFDRVLRLQLPDAKEREEILKIHTRSKPLDTGVSLARIAGQTDSFTGADLEALANEAALLAVRRTRDAGAGDTTAVAITTADFEKALANKTKSNKQFDRLDSILVESVSQFSEPIGRAVARVTLTTGTVLEGDVLWMNAGHIKLRVADGSEVIVAKDMAEQIVPLNGTQTAPSGDFAPDRWAGRSLDVG